MTKAWTIAGILGVFIMIDAFFVVAAVIPVDVPETLKQLGTMFIGLSALVAAAASIVSLFKIESVHKSVNSALDAYKREAADREAAVLVATVKTTRVEEQQIASDRASELAKVSAIARADTLAEHVLRINQLEEKLRRLEQYIPKLLVPETPPNPP